MTAAEALELANAAQPDEPLHRYWSVCGPRGRCRRQPCENDPGRWTWCPDCLTLYDAYGKAVNPIRKFQDGALTRRFAVPTLLLRQWPKRIRQIGQSWPS
jgi:hypothetical protein